MSEDRKPIPFVTYDADGRIDMDLPCLKCGYNLRKLRDDAKCPECGVSITELARIGWLFQSDPDWLHRLAVATIWIGVADVCFASYLSAIIVPTVPLRIGLTTAMEICGLVSIPAGAVAAGRPASCYSRLGAAAHRLPQEGGH